MAPRKKATASPTPAPTKAPPARNLIADAFYAWAIENHSPGHLLLQDELLNAGIVPNNESGIKSLLDSVTYLTAKSLFKIHDRFGGGIGWELVDPEVAKNYDGLNRDEHMVLQVIQGARNSGIWTKTVASKTNLQQAKLDKIFKALEGRNLITSMKGVSHPSRKMFIITGLKPSEEATGGSWFSEGKLDEGLITATSGAIENWVSRQSWQQAPVEDSDDPYDSSSGQKRKRPDDGFEEHNNHKIKVAKVVDERGKTKHSKHHGSAMTWVPKEPGYQFYPTVQEITRYLHDSNVINVPLPQGAITQLLQVMVYDDRLFKVLRPARADESAEDLTNNMITMYRCLKTPAVLADERSLEKRKTSADTKVRTAAYRQEELESLGPGGTSEAPCMQCPVFDICGDGGPVNPGSCIYFEEWYEKIDEADKEKEVKEKKLRERDKGHTDKGKGKEKDFGLLNGDRGPSIEIELEEELEPS